MREMDQYDQKFQEAMRIIDGKQRMEDMTIDHCRAYVRHHKLVTTGNKAEFLARIRRHRLFIEHPEPFPSPSLYTMRCSNEYDVCENDLIMFEEKDSTGSRRVAATVVHISAKGNNIKLEVSASDGDHPLPFMSILPLTKASFRHMKVQRQEWADEGDRNRRLQHYAEQRGKPSPSPKEMSFKFHDDYSREQPSASASNKSAAAPPSEKQYSTIQISDGEDQDRSDDLYFTNAPAVYDFGSTGKKRPAAAGILPQAAKPKQGSEKGKIAMKSNSSQRVEAVPHVSSQKQNLNASQRVEIIQSAPPAKRKVENENQCAPPAKRSPESNENQRAPSLKKLKAGPSQVAWNPLEAHVTMKRTSESGEGKNKKQKAEASLEHEKIPAEVAIAAGDSTAAKQNKSQSTRKETEKPLQEIENTRIRADGGFISRTPPETPKRNPEADELRLGKSTKKQERETPQGDAFGNPQEELGSAQEAGKKKKKKKQKAKVLEFEQREAPADEVAVLGDSQDQHVEIQEQNASLNPQEEAQEAGEKKKKKKQKAKASEFEQSEAPADEVPVPGDSQDQRVEIQEQTLKPAAPPSKKKQKRKSDQEKKWNPQIHLMCLKCKWRNASHRCATTNCRHCCIGGKYCLLHRYRYV